jgi:Flp pilus assembly protein TadB
MAHQVEHDPALPPPAEALHMPEPSYLPVVLALGIMITLVGILTGIMVVVIGAIISLTVLVRWIRSAREELNELPLEHHSRT